MRFECRIIKATDIHSKYVTLIAFPPQQWLHERAWTLQYSSFACIVVPSLDPWCVYISLLNVQAHVNYLIRLFEKENKLRRLLLLLLLLTYLLTYLLQLNCHPVAVALTLVQTKQIRISVHSVTYHLNQTLHDQFSAKWLDSPLKKERSHFYMTQGVPRSKHTPSLLQKPVS